jgi:hypothetical protein
VTPNPFDQAARYAAHQLDEPGFLHWLLPMVSARYRFHRWLNTRNTPFPGEPERVCDTVAAWTHSQGAAPPLATVIEFLTEPSTRFLEHLADYTFEVRRGHPYQAEHPLVPYEVVGVLVVLTGTEQPKTWRCRPDDVEGAGGEFTVVLRTLATQSAVETLGRIMAGELSRCVLPWIALMQGGGESGSIALWKELAGGEPDARKRGDYAGLLLVFAELAGTRQAWETALEDWNMVESQVVKGWQEKARKEGRAEGRAEAMRANLELLLQSRSAESLPREVLDKFAAADADTLQQWFTLALTVNSLDEFRSQLNGV